MKLLYRVYDENLKNYLLDCGLRYELKALDIVTKQKMWVFINSSKLYEFVKTWEGKSPKK